MKLLLSPVGLVALAVFGALLFAPRRSPGLLRRLRKPMRVFDDEDAPRRDETMSADGSSARDEIDDNAVEDV